MTVTVRPRRLGTRTAALAALAVAGTALFGAPLAVAAPNPGDVKVHAADTPFDDQRDEPKVCKFYLAAFNFAPNTAFTWLIETQPPVANGASRDGTLTTDANGRAHTEELQLPNGQYKVTWKIAGDPGPGKQKVFKVDCRVATPTPGPSGGVGAGGGGLARDEAFSPVAGAAAVGLVAVGGAAYLRTRRRSDGAA